MVTIENVIAHEFHCQLSLMEPFDLNHDKFINNMARMDSEDIYEYAIEPVGHQSEPPNGEVLDVEANN